MSATCPCCGAEVAPLDLLIDAERATVGLDGATVRLTRTEFFLFDFMVRAWPRPVVREAVLDAWPTEKADDVSFRSVDVIVHRIRTKMRAAGVDVETVRDVGYRLTFSPEAAEALRRRRSDALRVSIDQRDVDAVADLQGKGWKPTAIAQRLGMTHGAVAAAIDAAGPSRTVHP